MNNIARNDILAYNANVAIIQVTYANTTYLLLSFISNNTVFSIALHVS